MSLTRTILFTLTLLAAPAMLADARTILGPNAVKAVELAVRSAIPDGELTWESRIFVKRANGSRSDVVVAGFAQTTTARGPVVVVQIELGTFAEAAAKRLASFSTEPADQPTDVLAAVQLSPAGEVLESKIGRLDPTSATVETKDLALVDDSDGAWPSVEVTYWARYGTPTFHGSVRWYAVYDFDLMETWSRMPLGVTKYVKGGDELSEPVAATRMDDVTVHVEGGITGHLLALPCPAPCLFDGLTLLAGWTSSMPTAPRAIAAN